MNVSSGPTPPRSGGPRDLWALGIVVVLLAINPALLSVGALRGPIGARNEPEGRVATIFDQLTSGFQSTAVILVAAGGLVAFRRLLPVFRSLFLSSLAGLLIAAELAVVFWLVYGGLAGVGMPGLFWNPDAWTMLRSAFGITLFMYWMLYLAFVHDFAVHSHEPTRQIWRRFRPVLEASGLPAFLKRPIGTDNMVGAMRWFLAYAGLPALVGLAVPAVLPAARPGGGRVAVEWPWLAGMALGAGLTWVIVKAQAPTRVDAMLIRLLTIGRKRHTPVDPDASNRVAKTNTWNILIIVTVVVLFAHLDWYAGDKIAMSPFPPPFSICVMLGVLATGATFFSTRTWRTRAVSITFLLTLVAATGLLDYDVEVHDLDAWYPSAWAQLKRRFVPHSATPRSYSRVINLESFQRAIPAGAADTAWRDRQTLLDRWAKSFAQPASRAREPVKPIMVVVTASGGALRAAIWTETVLGTLDQTFADFHRHVRLITGASGGMLGGARYVCGHAKGTGVPGSPGLPLPAPDYLTPIAWQIAFRDIFPNALFPWATYNRGDVLEDAWLAFDDGIARTFSDIKALEDVGLLPSIVFSPMLVEDGRRLLISNLPLYDLTVNQGNDLLREDVEFLRRRYRQNHSDDPDRNDPDEYALGYPNLASISAVEFFRLFGEPGRDKLRLATAVLMSSTFPYVTSSAALPTDPPRHLVDAGYYDNYGVNLAASWVFSHRLWISAHTSGVLLVQVRAFRNERRLKTLSEQILARPSGKSQHDAEGFSLGQVAGFLPRLVSLVADGLKSFVLPVEGIAKARDSSMYFRNDEQLLGLHTAFTELTHDNQFFRSVIFTCDTYQRGQSSQDIETLNWYIDPQEFDEVRHGMEPYANSAGAAQSVGGLSRNYLRVRSLLKWWTSRGGRLVKGAALGPDP